MEITARVHEETELIKKLLKNVRDAEEDEANDLVGRMRKNQPFIVTLLMSFGSDVSDEQFEDLLELFCVTYMFFEQKTNIKKIEITEEIFNKHYEQNIQFIDYLSGEDGTDEQIELSAADLEKIHYKSLYTAMIFLMDESETLDSSKDEELKAGVLLIMKALIECMEANLLDQ